MMVQQRLLKSFVLVHIIFPMFVYSLDVRRVKHGAEQCFDYNHERIECPKKPWSVGKILAVVIPCSVSLAIVLFFIIRHSRRKRTARKYDEVTLPLQTSYEPKPAPQPMTYYA